MMMIIVKAWMCQRNIPQHLFFRSMVILYKGTPFLPYQLFWENTVTGANLYLPLSDNINQWRQVKLDLEQFGPRHSLGVVCSNCILACYLLFLFFLNKGMLVSRATGPPISKCKRNILFNSGVKNGHDHLVEM